MVKLDRVYGFRCSSEFLDKFMSIYPRGTLQVFLTNCIKRALRDRDFFEAIFFGEKK